MKKFFVLFSLMAIILSVFSFVRVFASGDLDQYCSNSNPTTYQIVNRNGTDYRQSFVPTKNHLTSVRVKIGGPPSGISGIALLKIYDAPSGGTELSSTTRNYTNLNETEYWYFNDLDVSLTAGSTYYIRLMSSTDHMYWYTTDGCGGHMAYYNGDVQGYGLDFATWGTTVAVPGAPESPAATTSNTTSTATGEALGTTSASIAKPTSLTAAYSDESKGIKLAWKASTTTDIDGYKIFRSEASGTPLKIAEVVKTKLEYLDQDFAAGKTYSYQVRAYKGTSQSASSNIATATVPNDIAPAKPVSFKIVDKTFDMITAMWRKSSDPTLAGYTINLYRGNEKIRTAEISASFNNYSFFDLEPGTLYKVELIAKNAKGLTSTPAVAFGSTVLPEEVENLIDKTKIVAAAVVLLLLTILVINTVRHYKKK